MLAARGVISEEDRRHRRGPVPHQGAHRCGHVPLRHQRRGHPHVGGTGAHRATSADAGDAAAHGAQPQRPGGHRHAPVYAKKRGEAPDGGQRGAARGAGASRRRRPFRRGTCLATPICSMPSRCCSRTICWPTSGCWSVTSSGLHAARRAADANPLGSAALAGTTYPTRPRTMTAADWASRASSPTRSTPCPTGTSCLTCCMPAACRACTSSRLCEETHPVVQRRVRLRDAGRQRSPRARPSCRRRRTPTSPNSSAARRAAWWGDLVALLVTMKSLPLAYNKDLQEDKEGAIDAAKTLEDCCRCAAGMVADHAGERRRHAGAGEEGLSWPPPTWPTTWRRRACPSVRAHEVVGHLVLLCEKRGCDLEDLSLEDFKAESDLFEADIAGESGPGKHRGRPHHVRWDGTRRRARTDGRREGPARFRRGATGLRRRGLARRAREGRPSFGRRPPRFPFRCPWETSWPASARAASCPPLQLPFVRYDPFPTNL